MSSLRLAKISVTVIDAFNGYPILTAAVVKSDGAYGVGDGEGIYWFNDVPIGGYEIFASAPGYIQNRGYAYVREGGTGSGQVAGGQGTSITIPLTPIQSSDDLIPR